MMITISIVSIVIGYLVGYKVGYSLCVCQYRAALDAVKASSENQGKRKS